jgi:hypothetical protein
MEILFWVEEYFITLLVNRYRYIILCTGCSITPCSAISQASCRSPDDRRGAALPQEDVGDMLV